MPRKRLAIRPGASRYLLEEATIVGANPAMREAPDPDFRRKCGEAGVSSGEDPYFIRRQGLACK
jgi:hypothetical protein